MNLSHLLTYCYLILSGQSDSLVQYNESGKNLNSNVSTEISGSRFKDPHEVTISKKFCVNLKDQIANDPELQSSFDRLRSLYGDNESVVILSNKEVKLGSQDDVRSR